MKKIDTVSLNHQLDLHEPCSQHVRGNANSLSIEDSTQNTSLEDMVRQIQNCQLCQSSLPYTVRPIVQLNSQARILIASQAPGRKAHDSGIPFDDPSGERLRYWLGIGRDQFYDSSKIAILPMGFCYPGKGKTGDLPPRRECEPAWRRPILQQLPNIELTLVIGQYAQAYHLGKNHDSVTNNVQNWQDYWPDMLPLPHPSPRNIFWFKRNPWFEKELIPILQQRVKDILCL